MSSDNSLFFETFNNYLSLINQTSEEQLMSENLLKQILPNFKIDENKKKNYYEKENLVNSKINKSIKDRYGNLTSDEFGSSVYIKKKSRNVFEGYENLIVPDEVRDEANSIYNNQLGRKIQVKKLSLLKFYCVYSAYKKLNIPIVPQTLAKNMNMSSKIVNKANTIFSELQTGYQPPDNNLTPIDFLPEYSKFLEINEETLYECIIPFAEVFLLDKKEFLQDHPHIVAAGLIKWYCTMNGLILKKMHKLKNQAGCSDATIDTMYKRISGADS